MGKSTFQGYVRTYGGQDRSSGVTPGTLVASEVITFLSSTATATAVSVGATVNANAPFVLPQGLYHLTLRYCLLQLAELLQLLI